jgi:Uma2 family endonuclease
MTIAEPITRRWTRAEYYRLAEEGWFTGQRVMLMSGEILHRAPQGHHHTRTYLAALDALTNIFGSKRIRPQLPLNVPGESDPEPDLAVTEKDFVGYTDHPTTAVLVIEIADSSLAFDRRKAGLYASAGIPDYWIINVNARRLEIFRKPLLDPQQEFGTRYAEQFELDHGCTIAPLAAPNSKIEVISFF